MRSLIDRLGLLARFDAEDSVLQPEPLDVREVAETAVAVVAPLAQEQGVTLQTDPHSVVTRAEDAFYETAAIHRNLNEKQIHESSICLLALAGVVCTNVLCAVQPYVIADTGQTKCFDNSRVITPPKPGQPFYGQDAQRQTHPASYTLRADGLTVRDLVTGLTWQRSPDTDGDGEITSRDKLTLTQAQALTAKLNAAKFGGFDDWRVPSIKELESLVDYTRSPATSGTAAMDTNYFACTTITNEAGQTDHPYFWSSTILLDGGPTPSGNYIAFGRAMGYMNGAWVDVHGAGSQKSDILVGNPASYPYGRGPQGDAVRIYNFVRLVRGGLNN